MSIVTVSEAATLLKLSKSYFYHLPQKTPGIFRFGRAIRIDMARFTEWATRNHKCVG